MQKNIFANPRSNTPSLQAIRSKITISTIRRNAIFGLAFMATTLSGHGFAQQPGTKQFVPFRNFVENTKAANADNYLTRADSKVKDKLAFEEMRQHIIHRYDGVDVSHSFVVDGNHYDCVPTEQQPAVRKYGLKSIASAPPLSLLKSRTLPDTDAAGNAVKPATQVDPDKAFDAFGNSAHCETGTVPLLRVSLETMSHFSTLQQFFQKVPDGAVRAVKANSTVYPQVASHKYSYTIQTVDNLGGNSNLNVWSPYVNTAAGEIFSLSQEWYVGGSGSGLQTEEVGWVVYPAMFNNDESSHFFIFSTADGYATGCWNNTCGDFVQVADSGLLGASFSNYSTFGGTQYEFSAEYYLYQGNWWLGYQGTWVGYYPGSKYYGGQNTRNAQIIGFGSESVGTSVWPGEGSGDWSSAGFGYAAYQRNLYYISPSGTSYWDSLTPEDPSPACYTISGPYSSTSSGWNVYFYEGGPGGSGC